MGIVLEHLIANVTSERANGLLGNVRALREACYEGMPQIVPAVGNPGPLTSLKPRLLDSPIARAKEYESPAPVSRTSSADVFTAGNLRALASRRANENPLVPCVWAGSRIEAVV